MNAAATGAVILGAGFSRRFGNADKRLARLTTGATVAATTVATYSTTFSACRVVLRSDDNQLAELLADYPVELIYTDDAALGMGHSLAAGVAGLDWRWTFIALLDMPFIKSATLTRLIKAAAASQQKILQPRLTSAPESPAHPIGFHQSLLTELAASKGDTGARHVLNRHRNTIERIDLDDPGLVRDIDLPGDAAGDIVV